MSRLNKYLADCGVGSRRECDKLIADGCVKINGKIASLGANVEENDSVSVNGRRVTPKTKNYYIMLHKPKGCVTTVKDDLGRKTVMDFVDIKARLFPVGRLDYDTEGLLILTNDGDVANKLTHPKNNVEKVYVARLSGSLTEAERQTLERGVEIDGRKTMPARVKILAKDEHHTRVEVTITEGRNRQVKKMFESVGKEVEFLKRVAEGELRLGGLQRGKYRFLNDREIEYLKGL
ncbi:MAG TPA: rRNA pseudouridine synthase [Candidatus Fimimonas gallinarum]|uniref:Pseudouridine synthase n=1 Tax=Candidatus Fimimonas gallinarum TaxID=2840821 RepID=A0A9D1E3I2_9BACT|nr:rRNA pseudouridine synthase [Candidatus Fimimonas gallinarum]